jgi:hypothetical protein
VYLSHENLRAVEKAGALPFTPFKLNTVEPTEASMGARMYHLFIAQARAVHGALPQVL